MNELIKLDTVKGQNEPFISSVLVADLFEKRHTDVLRDICNKYNSGQRTFASSVLVSGKAVIIEGTYKNKQNKKQKMYYLNERAFQKLALGFTGERAEKYQDMILDEFDKMKQMIIDLQLGKPEAIISLLTWKNTNMETTIRTYVNGGNVLNVIPPIVDECKQKVENGEMKTDLIAVIIRTLEDMRNNEPIIGNRDNYATAILEINHKLRHLQGCRIGGIQKSNNDLRARIEELKEERYSQQDYLDFIESEVGSDDYRLLSDSLEEYIGFIAKNKFNGDFKEANNFIYRTFKSQTGIDVSKIDKKSLGVSSIREALYAMNPGYIEAILSIAVNEAILLGFQF